MKILLVGALAAFGVAATVQAAPESHGSEITAYLEPVDHIPALRRLHSWNVVDQDTLIVWATAFDPYLIELSFPSQQMRFAHVIGVTEFAGRVHSRFDSVYVDGLKHRIAEIYRISPEDAKAL